MTDIVSPAPDGAKEWKSGSTDGVEVGTAAEEKTDLPELAVDGTDTEIAETPADEDVHSDGPIPISKRTFANRQERQDYERSEARIKELSEMNGLSYETNDYLERALYGYEITNDLLETIRRPDFEAVVSQVLSQGEAQMPLNEKLCVQCTEVIRLIRHIDQLDEYRKKELGTHFAAARGESDFEGYQAAKKRFATNPEPTLKAAIEDGEKRAARWEDDIRKDQERLNTLLETMAADINAIKNHRQTDTITVVPEDDYKSDKVIGLYSLRQGMGVFVSKADDEKIQGLIYPKSESAE